MKVSELIEKLGYMDKDAEVHFAYSYGGNWRTKVAPTVDHVEKGHVEHSSYHSMDRLVKYDGSLKEGVRTVVVLT